MALISGVQTSFCSPDLFQLYYSAVGALQEIIRRYAEQIGTWPRTVITGRGAEIIKDDCQFIDTYVPNLVVKGIALAYRKWFESKE